MAVENQKRLTIREAKPSDAESIGGVHVAAWRATYYGLMPDQILTGLSITKRAKMWKTVLTDRADSTCILVAETGAGKTVGFVAAGQATDAGSEQVGEIFALYLLPDFQRRGAGRQLFLRALQWLARYGYQKAMLWVLAENPAKGFYEKLGGTAGAEKWIQLGGQDLREIAYVWHFDGGVSDQLRP